MDDHDKTRAELIAEVEDLRRRVAQWEASQDRQNTAETALRESEKRYRALVETIPHGIQECDTAGCITFANAAHHCINGYAHGQLVGKEIWDLLSTEEEKAGLRQYLAYLVEQQPPPTPYLAVNRRKDGTTYDVQVDWDYRRNGDGTLTGFIAIITDVTRRKQAEDSLRRGHDELEWRVNERTRELAQANEKLTKEIAERKLAEKAFRNSEEKLRCIFESSQDCIIVWDRNHDYLYVNQAALDHVGVPREQVECKNIRDGLGHMPEFMKVWTDRIDQVFVSGESMRVDDSGSVGDRFIYSESVLSPIRNDQGEVFAVGVVYRDVSERREAENAARESEERFRLAFEEGPLGMVIGDLKGLIVTVNRALCQILGYSSPELEGLSIDELTHPDDRYLNHWFIRQLREQEPKRLSVEKRYLRKNGEVIWGRVTASVLPGRPGEPKHALAMIEDITEQKAAQKAVEMEQRHLRRLLEMHEHDRRLVAYEIHDGFVQSLVGARMLLDMPRKRLEPEMHERFGNAVNLLDRGIDEARRLISGQRPLILDERGLMAAIEHLVCERKTLDGPEITYRDQVSFGRLQGRHETAVFRVAQEALNNAERHSQSPEVQLRVTQHDGRLRVEIEDWGVGFDPDNIGQNCFGLEGLRERARIFGGTAEIRSTLGKGTLVTVEFPIVEKPDETTA